MKGSCAIVGINPYLISSLFLNVLIAITIFSAPDDYVLDTAQEAFSKFGCPIDLDLDTCDDFLKDDVTNYMKYVEYTVLSS